MAKLSWDGLGSSHMAGSGKNFNVSTIGADAVNVMAIQIAAAHYERVYRASKVNVMAIQIAAAHYERVYRASKYYSPDSSSYGYTVATHLPETNPKEWEAFKADALSIIKTLHGSGEKDMSWSGSNDSKQYFDALHDVADSLRNS